MAEWQLTIEEYLWFTEYQQGNVNVVGLVYDDLVEETLCLEHEVYTVWVEQIFDSLELTEGDFTITGSGPIYRTTGIHWTAVSDTVAFAEFFGSPIRVKQSVISVAMTNPVVPALIAHMHLDVLHGVDTYWEEVSDELQCHSFYANAVPYYWEWIYESIDIDMTEPQPLPPIYLRLYLSNNDLVNMRHDVTQEYYFNSKCFEEFFVWDGIVWGWDHKVAESLVSTETMQEIIGKVADDYLLMQESASPRVSVLHILDDRVFIFDEGTHEKYYLLTAADTIAIMEDQVSFRAISGVDPIVEALGISETVSTQTVFMRLAAESLTFADIPALLQEFLIEEGLEMGDVDLARWVFNVLAESGFDVADIIG
jgi:hypothetical protein